LRGGFWSYDADGCRSANRGYDYPTYSSYNFGFRSVLPSGQP
jgi:formylglycine-generating enzyme required for sulfatase activity